VSEARVVDTDGTFALRQKLADELMGMSLLQAAAVETAFRAVPRHLFVPGVPLEKAYTNTWIGTKSTDGGGWISSSSSPDIMAIMLEQLVLEPGHRVLEIGAGTGYNAALIAHIVGPSGHVATLDIDEDIVAGAREHLAAAGVENVQAVCSDGGFGFAEAAPFDRIILSVGSGDITSAWREQLRPGGRIVLPLWLERYGSLQASVAFEKRETHLASVSLKHAGFMPLRGAFALEGLSPIQLGPEPGLEFVRDDGGAVDAEGMYRLLTGPHRDVPTDVQVAMRDVMGGLYLWLLPTYEAEGCGLTAREEWLRRGIVPYLIGAADKFCSAGGLMEGTARCALAMRPPDHTLPAEISWNEPPFSLYVRSYGPDDTLADKYIGLVKAWDAAGRPGFERLHIRAVALDNDYSQRPNEHILTRPSTRLVLTWDA
jgi:protein-L-isoaspartate(D-aspartate) O-methyltransferase